MTSKRTEVPAAPDPLFTSETGENLSLDFLSQILGSIYDAALDQSGWASCLETVRKALAANYASLIVRSETIDDVGLIVSAGERQDIDPGNPFIAMSPFTGMKPDQLLTIAHHC